jgi:hypothetical protein
VAVFVQVFLGVGVYGLGGLFIMGLGIRAMFIGGTK